MALHDKVLPEDRVVASELTEALRGALVQDTLPCAAAFRLAEERNFPPLAVGQAADALEIRLSACQLGLFGYPGHAKGWATVAERPVSPALKAALLAAAGENRRLTCSQLWELAAQWEVPRLQLGHVADQLGIKIEGCQLGAF
ncbi:MAG: hypothetical protein GYA30_04760 [Chloroflexi bacterium]|nr:hypothetical protein [Chloroflexota bacterium]